MHYHCIEKRKGKEHSCTQHVHSIAEVTYACILWAIQNDDDIGYSSILTPTCSFYVYKFPVVFNYRPNKPVVLDDLLIKACSDQKYQL